MSNSFIRRKNVLLVLLFGCSVAGFRRELSPVPYTFPELPYFPQMPAANANPVTNEGVALGRYLFYDPELSRDNSLSCGSCHRQEAAFSDSPVARSIGYGGTLQSRNTLPLFNLAWYPALFWDGRAASLEEQVFHPVRGHHEMNLEWTAVVRRLRRSPFYRARFRQVFGGQEIDSNLIAKAIAQFERTLLSYRSRYDSAISRKAYFTPEEIEGLELMNDMTKGNCLHCHSTDGDALGVLPGFSNNGLDAAGKPEDYPDKGRGNVTGNPGDYGKFKIPSLRNLAFTAPFMHDGRFKTLEEVLDFYSNGVHDGMNTDGRMRMGGRTGAHLSREEQRKIIVFLRTLTDSAFISDPAFSNPFRQPKQ